MLVFIPIVNGIKYNFSVIKFKLTIQINGITLRPTIDEIFPYEIAYGGCYRNVFTLPSAVAVKHKSKIDIRRTTSNKYTYVRGFIFPFSENTLNDLKRIFAGEPHDLRLEDFGVHIDKDGVRGVNCPTPYIRGELLREYEEQGSIKVFLGEPVRGDKAIKVRMPMVTVTESTCCGYIDTVPNGKLEYWYYWTLPDNVAVINKSSLPQLPQGESNKIMQFLNNEWDFHNEKISINIARLAFLKSLEEKATNGGSYDEFGLLASCDHKYLIMPLYTIDLDELKKRFMELLDNSLKYGNFNGTVENYEMNLAKYINKIEKEYKSKKALLVKVIHIDYTRNVIELIDSILPED